MGIFLLFFQFLSCLFSTKLLKLIYKNRIKDLRSISNWIEISNIYDRAEQEYWTVKCSCTEVYWPLSSTKGLNGKKIDWKPLEAVHDVEFWPPGVWGREYGRRQYLPTHHQYSSLFPSWRFQFWCNADWRLYNFVKSACLFLLENEYKTAEFEIHQRAVLTMLPQKIHQCTAGPLKDKVKISQLAQWFFPLICSNGSNIWKYLARNPEKWAEDVKSWERCQKSSLQWIDYSLSESQVAKKVWKM